MGIVPIQTSLDRYVKVGQINTRYWALGDKGTTVILLHGGGSWVEFWMYNIEALAQYRCVYALDMVGSGRSDKPLASYSLTYQAQFVKDFIDVLSIESVSLIGHSMGGGVALQFALMFSKTVEKLVLANSFGLGKEIDSISRLAALPFVDKLVRPSRSGTVQVLKPCVYDPSVIPDEWVELGYQMSTLPGALNALLTLVRTNLNLFGVRSEVFSPIVNQLATITAPTLVVWGQQDCILPVAHAYVAAKGLPNARLHIFNLCGHWSPVEYPEEFNSLVVEFLANA